MNAVDFQKATVQLNEMYVIIYLCTVFWGGGYEWILQLVSACHIVLFIKLD